MTDIVLGPFSFPAVMLLAFAAVLVAHAVGNRLAGDGSAAVERSLWLVLGLAMLGARGAFVLSYLEFYMEQPLHMLDIRDGGFTLSAGIAAGIAAGAWLAWRRVAQRRALLAALAAGCMVWGAGSAALSRPGPRQVLPELTLATLEGGATPLAAMRGRPLVVNLWASWCPPCRREMPVLAKSQREAADVAFVFVNQGEPAAAVKGYLAAEGLALRNVLLDSAGALAKATGAAGLPTTLFFNAKGELVERRTGELSAATLAQRLEALRQAAATSDK